MEDSRDSTMHYYNLALHTFKPFDVDVLNYLIVGVKNNLWSQTKTDSLLTKYIVKSEAYRKHYKSVLRRRNIPHELKTRVKKVQIIKDTDYIRDQRFMDSILKIDQRIRNPIIFAFRGWENTYLIDSSNYLAIQKYFCRYKNFGVMKGPVDDMTIIYLHNTSRLKESEMIGLIEAGLLHPNSYPYIYFRMGILDGTSDKYGRDFRVRERSAQEIAQIDMNRAKIGLRSTIETASINSSKLRMHLLTHY